MSALFRRPVSSPSVSHRSRFRLGAAAAVAAAAAIVATAVPAHADTFNGGLTKTWTWGDCTMWIGPVQDTVSPPAAIGGTTISCSKRHSYISATVQLKFNGAVVPGSSASTSYLNAYGFGGRILKTPRFCGAGSWQEVATYSIPDLGTGYVTSGSPDSWRTGC